MDDKKPKSVTSQPEDDPFAEASEEELALSARLREALDDPSKANESADLARALSLSFEPREIAEPDHRKILEAAAAKLKAPSTNVIALHQGHVRRRRQAVSLGVATAIALAAGAILLVGQLTTNTTSSGTVASSGAPALLQTRSTQPLFEEPFARTGGASARIDRIAMARSSDLRSNRFAKWGVR